MTESLVWNKKSIMDLTIDTMIESTGTATLSDGSLTLGANSSCAFSYTFDTTNNIMETSDLKFILNVINSNETVSSRYDESVQIEAYIQYYEKTVDSSGNITGYLLGGNDTYQINPYFRHEVEGYTDTYEVNIDKNMLSHITIYFINMYDNTITFVNPRVFNSMSVMDAIDEYGGGEEPGPSEPTLKNDLILYSTSGNYTISNTDGQLTLEVELSDDIIKKYANRDEISLRWLCTAKSGQGSALIGPASDYKYVYIDGVKYTIYNSYRTITAISNGVINVRVEIDGDNTVYAERNITMTNNEVVDMELKIESPSGKVEGTNYSNASIKLLPETNRSGYGGAGDDMKIISLVTYDGGEAEIGSWEGTIEGGRVNFQIRGKKSGKVKLTVQIIPGVYTNFYPLGFTKEFIIDVVGIPVLSDLYTRTPNGKVIDVTKEYIDIIVGTNRSNTLSTSSSYGLESLDGVGQGYVTLLNSSDSKELTYRVYPVAVGKIKFWGNMQEDYSGYKPVGRVEVNIDITALYKELTTEITTNTGLFEITQGGGQLEVHCTPNYSYAGDYSFSQVSIDGGSVSIDDKGDYALITADREGKFNLICKPDRGKSVQREINVSNQYPENVQLTCADNIFKVPINGTLIVYAEAGNKPNSNYDRYNWEAEKLDADVGYSGDTWDKNCKFTGTALGKFRLSAVRRVDSKFMTSQVIKVVQTLDSDKTVLTYPNTQQYWVVYRRTDQGNRLWLETIDGTVTLNKLIKKNDNRLYTDNINIGARAQWKIENGQWANYASWTNNTTAPASNVGTIYASNIDIYDESGNLLVAKTDNYDDVDFDKIIYG